MPWPKGSRLHQPKPSLTRIITILAGLAGVAMVSCHAQRRGHSLIFQKIQAQVVTDHMHAILQAKSVEVDLEYYENARIKIRCIAHNKKRPSRPTAILNALLQFGQDAISLLAMAAILWWLHWGVIPVLVLTALPYLFVRLQQLQPAVCLAARADAA